MVATYSNRWPLVMTSYSMWSRSLRTVLQRKDCWHQKHLLEWMLKHWARHIWYSSLEGELRKPAFLEYNWTNTHSRVLSWLVKNGPRPKLEPFCRRLRALSFYVQVYRVKILCWKAAAAAEARRMRSDGSATIRRRKYPNRDAQQCWNICTVDCRKIRSKTSKKGLASVAMQSGWLRKGMLNVRLWLKCGRDDRESGKFVWWTNTKQKDESPKEKGWEKRKSY